VNYDYRMVQVPPNIVVKRKEHAGNEAAIYLQEIATQHAAQGWEFYRVDTIDVKLQPGCLGMLLGQREAIVNYYVVTFRHPR
jgi:hypothetical protein